jgi:hypothetical protein
MLQRRATLTRRTGATCRAPRSSCPSPATASMTCACMTLHFYTHRSRSMRFFMQGLTKIYAVYCAISNFHTCSAMLCTGILNGSVPTYRALQVLPRDVQRHRVHCGLPGVARGDAQPPRHGHEVWRPARDAADIQRHLHQRRNGPVGRAERARRRQRVRGMLSIWSAPTQRRVAM